MSTETDNSTTAAASVAPSLDDASEGMSPVGKSGSVGSASSDGATSSADSSESDADNTPCFGNEASPGNEAAPAAAASGTSIDSADGELDEGFGESLGDDLDEPCPGNEAPRSRAVAETAWDEESLEPGDDIGNRIDGPAHHERTMTGAEAAVAAKRLGKRPKRKEFSKEAEAVVRPRPRGSVPPRERPTFRVGEEVFGKVVGIEADAIRIDLSGKAEAICDRREVEDDSCQVGDQFVATVHGDGTRGGLVVLTKDPTRAENAKETVNAAMESDGTVDALVTGVIKGGIELDVDGLRAFAPGSHVDLRLGADLSYLIGRRLQFKVMKYAKNGKEVVLSRRELLEKEAQQSRQDGLAKLQPGTVVDAVVRSVVEWGVFVAIPSANDIEGLVHISEASFDRNPKLGELFKIGETTQVKVLRIDEKGKLWLSRNAAAGDPWEAVAAKYAVGVRATGRIVRMQPFGVFVELAPGIDGLIRTGDLSVRRISDPSELVSVGEQIDVVVVHVDSKQHRIGLHPALPTEGGESKQKVAVNRNVQVEVVSAETGGLTVRILGVTGASARGFIQAGQTNTARGTDLRREFPVGTRLEAKVLDIDTRRGEVKMSIRALKEDTEKAAYHEYRTKAARESKFGTLGDVLRKRRGN